MADQITTIAEAVQRIINAKADIIDAIEEKSVTVPDDARISDLASYIEKITTDGTSLPLLTAEDLVFDAIAGTMTIPVGFQTDEFEIHVTDIDKDALDAKARAKLIEQLAAI